MKEGSLEERGDGRGCWVVLSAPALPRELQQQRAQPRDAAGAPLPCRLLFSRDPAPCERAIVHAGLHPCSRFARYLLYIWFKSLIQEIRK